MTPNLPKLQRQAKQAFRSSKLGKILIETQREVERGTANAKTLMTAGASIRNITGAEATRNLMEEMGLGSSWSMIERYAGKDAWKSIVGHLGSVGKLLKSLERSAKAGGARVEPREVELAANLLKAFGYTVGKPGQAADVPEFAELDPKVQQIIEEQERQQKARAISSKLKSLPGWQQPEQQLQPSQRAADLPEGQVNMQTEMILVQSSNVHSIGFRYDSRDIGTLLVRYLAVDENGHRHGPGSLYEYFQVPAILFERFKQAGSKGGFVWDELRIRGTVSGHQYNYDLAGVTQGYVPRRAQTVFFRGPRGGLRATEAFVPRTFGIGEIKRGKLQLRQQQSQKPFQRIGKSFRVRK